MKDLFWKDDKSVAEIFQFCDPTYRRRLVRPEQRGPQEKGASSETPFICFGWATGLFDHCLC